MSAGRTRPSRPPPGGAAPPAMPHVRPAREGETERIREVLVEAFSDDPVMSWAFEDDASRPRYAGVFFDSVLRRLSGHGLVWTTDDVAGAAVWARPGEWRGGAGGGVPLGRG